jgi:hypothetical protein
MSPTSAGMVNYQTEWWHWSYGDCYCAHATGAETTLYGPIHLARPDGRGLAQKVVASLGRPVIPYLSRMTSKTEG